MQRTTLEMAFPTAVRLAVVTDVVVNDTVCPICQEPMPPDSAIDFHSATELHLVYVLDSDGNPGYLVTDPPPAFIQLKGKILPLSANPLGPDQETDGLLMCEACHTELHNMALAEATYRIPDFSGHTVPPSLLSEVTLFCLDRAEPLFYCLKTV